MWKSFLSSIGLLTIAMLSALYSSNATRDGLILASAVSAFIALGIAIWVALKFVPRLAKGVEWDWIQFSTHDHVTKEGWLYFGALIIVVFAAVNRSEEHTSELQSHSFISYAVFCLKQKVSDYDPILALVADGPLCLLVEATRGTHEFYRERAEITKQLIKEKGFIFF